MQTHCTKCRGWWEQCSRAKSRSQSQEKRRATSKGQNNAKKDEAKPSDTQGSMLPSFMKWDGLGQPWQKSTPDGRLAKVQPEDSLELPPPAQLLPPPKPADELQEVAPEVRAHIESLPKSMVSAFTLKLEQDIIAAARAHPKGPRLEITHTDLNKAKRPRETNTMQPRLI